MASIEDRLKNMKGQIDDAKTSKAQLEGERKQQLLQLKDRFGVNTLGEAKKKLLKLQEAVPKLEQESEAKVAALESDYDW